MKKILGAIAAAMLLGAGCAHERGNQNQTDVPVSPQASVDSSAQGQLGAGGAGTAGGLECAVINGESASSTSSIGGVGSQSDQSTLGGSWDTSPSDQSGIGGSPSEAGAVDDTAISDSDTKDGSLDGESLDSADTDADVFEDTGMGGGGGGGG